MYFVNPLHCRLRITGTLPCLMQSRQSCLMQVVVVLSRIRTENWLLALLRHLFGGRPPVLHPRSPLTTQRAFCGRWSHTTPAHTPCRPHPLFFFASFFSSRLFFLSPWGPPPSYPPLVGPSRQAGKQRGFCPRHLVGSWPRLAADRGLGGRCRLARLGQNPWSPNGSPSSHAHLNHGPWSSLAFLGETGVEWRP